MLSILVVVPKLIPLLGSFILLRCISLRIVLSQLPDVHTPLVAHLWLLSYHTIMVHSTHTPQTRFLGIFSICLILRATSDFQKYWLLKFASMVALSLCSSIRLSMNQTLTSKFLIFQILKCNKTLCSSGDPYQTLSSPLKPQVWKMEGKKCLLPFLLREQMCGKYIAPGNFQKKKKSSILLVHPPTPPPSTEDWI
jgi:hypothetical protein